MKCLLVGNNYLPFKDKGDKNFWFDIVEELKGRLQEIHILSINSQITGVQHQGSNVWIHNITPTPVPTVAGGFHTSGLPASLNYFSRSISFIRIIKEAKRIISENSIDVIHFMDNYGPITPPLLLPQIKRPLGYSMMTYNPRYPAYDMLLKLTLNPFDITVVPNDAFREKLTKIGIRKDRTRKIRWGVRTDVKSGYEPAKVPDSHKNNNPDLKIIVWSGFIQQISFNDFVFSINVAKRVLEMNKSCRFVFCFKLDPKHINPKYEYVQYKSPGIEITVSQSQQAFLDLLDLSDIFISPILASRSTVTPPLTWLEAMQRGIPIVTTRAEGVGESIIDGYNGFISSTEEEMAMKICQLLEDESTRVSMGQNAKTMAAENFDLKHIADEYLELWSQMMVKHE